MKRSHHALRAGENEEEKHEKQSGAGHGSEKRGKHAPRAGKSEEEKKENRAERGMGVRKGAIMPRGQGKVKRKKGKTEPSGAWESEKEPSCPAGREK